MDEQCHELVCQWHGWSQHPPGVIEGIYLTQYIPFLGSARLSSKLAELYCVPLAMCNSSSFSISFLSNTTLGKIITDRKAVYNVLYVFEVLNSHVLLGPGLNESGKVQDGEKR